MTRDAIEAGIAATASKSTYAGAVSMFVGWVVSSNGAILVGMLVGVAGLCVNWYYKHKDDKRAARLHELKIERLQRGFDASDLGDLEDV